MDLFEMKMQNAIFELCITRLSPIRSNALNFCAESQLLGILFKFFKTNMIQSVAELIFYSQKHENVVIYFQIWRD